MNGEAYGQDRMQQQSLVKAHVRGTPYAVITVLSTVIQGILSKKPARVPAAHGEPRVYPEPAEGNHPQAGVWGPVLSP